VLLDGVGEGNRIGSGIGPGNARDRIAHGRAGLSALGGGPEQVRCLQEFRVQHAGWLDGFTD
jgi:hypothetical protein